MAANQSQIIFGLTYTQLGERELGKFQRSRRRRGSKAMRLYGSGLGVGLGLGL